MTTKKRKVVKKSKRATKKSTIRKRTTTKKVAPNVSATITPGNEHHTDTVYNAGIGTDETGI